VVGGQAGNFIHRSYISQGHFDLSEKKKTHSKREIPFSTFAADVANRSPLYRARFCTLAAKNPDETGERQMMAGKPNGKNTKRGEK